MMLFRRNRRRLQRVDFIHTDSVSYSTVLILIAGQLFSLGNVQVIFSVVRLQ
jgi:hypothetical protein